MSVTPACPKCGAPGIRHSRGYSYDCGRWWNFGSEAPSGIGAPGCLENMARIYRRALLLCVLDPPEQPDPAHVKSVIDDSLVEAYVSEAKKQFWDRPTLNPIIIDGEFDI